MTTTPSSAALAASATFVEQLYARFLNRSASAAEMEYWAKQIASGTVNAAEVSASFLASAEFQQAVDPVVRLYFTAFGRIPDAGGLKFWSGVASGLSAHEIGAAFAGSPEFDQLYGKVSDEAFLDTLYHNAFKRAPDAAGKQFWLDLLADGESRADIVVAFSHSDEMMGAMGDTVKVVEQYFGVHAVAPTAAQVAAALATLDPVALLTKLYASDAYTGADVPFLSRAGVVVDGYVKGATVTMTVTETVDGVETSRTVTAVTDDKGRFDFGDQAGFGDLVQTGGTDIATGAAVNGSYRAVAGSTVINPLTTLVAAIAADGKVDAAAAEAMVKARLGIDESVDLGGYDPIAVVNDTGSNAADQATALQVQEVLAQVNTIMGQAGAVLAGAGVAGGADGGANAAVAALSQMIQDASAALDLASAATAAAVLKDSAALAGATATQQATIDALASAAGTAVANLNTAIAGAAAAPGGTALSHLIAITQVQLVAEAVEAAMTGGVRAGSVSDSVTATTGAALASAIANAAAKVGDVNGDGRGDGAVAPAPGGSGSGSQPRPTFLVNVNQDTGDISFSGTARGNITFSIIDDKLVFQRGGLKGTPLDAEFNTLNLGAGQLLAVTSTQFGILDSMFGSIEGPGSLAMTVDQPILAVSLNGIGTAGITIAVTSDVELDEDASLGSAAITVAAGATLVGWPAAFDGLQVSGAGTLYLDDVAGGGAADLSKIAASVNVVAPLNMQADVRSLTNLGPVDEFVLGGEAKLTAEQADGARLAAAPGATGTHAIISGSDGNQRIDVSGLNYSIIAGGGGADQITLGAEGGMLEIAFGRAPVYQEQTLTLGGVYESGDVIEGALNEVDFTYTVTADDLAQANPMNAIAAKVALAVEAADAGNAVTTAVGGSGIVTITANALNQAFSFDAMALNRDVTWQRDSITLSGTYEVGDTIHVSTTSYGDVTYTVTESDLTADGAAGDPVKALANITSGLQTLLDGIFEITDKPGDNVIIVTSDGTQTVTASAGNAAPAAAQAQVSIVTPAGTYEEGDTLTIWINEIPVVIPVAGTDLVGDVLVNMAIKGAAALNQEFGSVLTASTPNAGEIKLVAKTAGTGFSLAAEASNYPGRGQQDTITLSGTYEAGDKIDVSVNGTAYSYTVLPDDLAGDANAQIAAKLALLLPGHSAQATGSVITINSDVVAGPVAVSASASNHPAVAQQDSLTLAGTYAEGDWIYVHIDAITVNVMVESAGLSGAALAAKMASDIVDFAGDKVNVTVGGATVTLTAKAAGTAYTLAADTSGVAGIITVAGVVANQPTGADTQVVTHENSLAYVAPGGDITQKVSVSTPTPNLVERVADGADNTQAAAHETVTGFIPAGADLTQSIESQVTVPVVAVAAPVSSLAEMDVVTGFTVGTSGLMLITDTGDIVVPNLLERLADVGSSNDLQATLAAAFDGKVAANAAAIVVINGGSAAGTYLYVNDDEAAYSATNDIFVKFVGISGLGGVGPFEPGAFFSGGLE